jgi:uncharacterized membrane protein HdeD (DUF308 family)
MKKTKNLVIAGIALSISGLAMIATEIIGVETAKVLLPLLFIMSGAFSIMFATANTEVKKPTQYHLFQGGIFVLFGLVIGILANSLGDFLKYTTYFILFFGIFDIIHGFFLLTSKFNLTWKVLVFKFFGGMFGTVGGVAILVTSLNTDYYAGLMITGIVTIVTGIGVIFFAARIKKLLI